MDDKLGGGATALSGGIVYAGGGTWVQREAGVEDTVDNMYAYLRGEVGDRITEPASGLLRSLPLLLVPPGVGVMVYAEQIAADFWALAGALGLSLLMSLLFAGWLMQKLIDRQARREERP